MEWVTSQLVTVTSGVAQGSVVGSTCFNVSVNPVQKEVKVMTSKTSLHMQMIYNLCTKQTLLTFNRGQGVINHVSQWSTSYLVSLPQTSVMWFIVARTIHERCTNSLVKQGHVSQGSWRATHPRHHLQWSCPQCDGCQLQACGSIFPCKRTSSLMSSLSVHLCGRIHSWIKTSRQRRVQRHVCKWMAGLEIKSCDEERLAVLLGECLRLQSLAFSCTTWCWRHTVASVDSRQDRFYFSWVGVSVLINNDRKTSYD